MDLIKCPRCGEKYSPSYRSCPFCEEDDYPRWKAAHGRKRVTRRRALSARGPIVMVLIVVLAVFSWYLFGDRLINQGEQDPSGVQVDDPGKKDPDTQSDPIDPNAGTEPPVIDDPPDNPNVGNDPPPVVPDASGATLNRKDFTISVDEKFQMEITPAELREYVTWSVDNADIVSISESGETKGISAGNTMIHATVGNRTLSCVVYVRGGQGGDVPAVDASKAAICRNDKTVVKDNDMTIRVGEKVQLKVIAEGVELDAVWSSANETYVSISENGLVQGVSAKIGGTKIYAEVGGKTLECIVRVKG